MPRLFNVLMNSQIIQMMFMFNKLLLVSQHILLNLEQTDVSLYPQKNNIYELNCKAIFISSKFASSVMKKKLDKFNIKYIGIIFSFPVSVCSFMFCKLSPISKLFAKQLKLTITGNKAFVMQIGIHVHVVYVCIDVEQTKWLLVDP